MDPRDGRESGFLLLTSHLGNPDRKPLTAAQLRTLTERVGRMERDGDTQRDMDVRDFLSMGYSRPAAERILSLLGEEELLRYYLDKAAKAGCVPITRMSSRYPQSVRRRLGLDSPGCLWAKGDLSVLETPAIALVGSRDLADENRHFAAEAGYQAARQGLTLISGNARGADQTAQNACLRAGGKVIIVAADSLVSHKARENVLYLSEDGFDEEFSAQRALSRNRVIHSLGQLVLVAQARLQKGGTWDGTSKNLRFGWSTVCCFRDGSDAAQVLEQMGAEGIGLGELRNLTGLMNTNGTLFDQ